MANHTPQEARIVKLLRNNADRSYSARDLGRKLGIKDNRAFRRFMADLHILTKRGEVVQTDQTFAYAGSTLVETQPPSSKQPKAEAPVEADEPSAPAQTEAAPEAKPEPAPKPKRSHRAKNTIDLRSKPSKRADSAQQETPEEPTQADKAAQRDATTAEKPSPTRAPRKSKSLADPPSEPISKSTPKPATNEKTNSRGSNDRKSSDKSSSRKPTVQDKKEDGATVGRLTVHPNGFGFVAVDGWEEDGFVGDRDMNGAFDGDTVAIEKRKGGDRRGRDSYRIVDIRERGRSTFVGTLTIKAGSATVQPDDTRVPYTFEVAKGDLNGAESGQKVMIRLKRFTKGMNAPEGAVESILGSADDPKVRVMALAMSLGARGDFSDEVVAEAEAIPDRIPRNVVKARRDLRKHRIFTIDPVDAKDFDDAIHVTELDGGDFEVGVHIADVSHYVTPGSELDKEAYERGTSIYLVDRVIPMLPEHLSNGVCSLVPKRDRLSYSCIMRVTASGEVASWEFVETVIHSQQRFSYEAAQAILDGQAKHRYSDDLHRANGLAHVLTKKRMASGSVDFNLPEVKIVLDEDGKVSGVRRKERIDTNRLVEEFMLLANQCAAREGSKKPFIYRVHDKPDPERMQGLADYVKAFGFKLPLTGGNVDSSDLNKLLAQVEGSPEAPVITTVALRAMSKAVYGPEQLGHYGLGFEHYSHFTSPIRRYPDIIAHRLLKSYTSGGKAADKDELAADGKHLSEREKAATTAERESVKLKQVEYLEQHLGETFDGVVSGVAKFGLFVELSAVLAEGLVPIRDLPRDRWEFDADRLTLTGQKSKRRFRPGDQLRVTVAAANPQTREVDLVIADE